MNLSTFLRTHYCRIGIYVITCIFILLPVFSIAQNNNCATPTALASSTACINTAGVLGAGATYTAATGLPGTICAVTNGDVWYSFVANSTNPIITLAQTTGVAGLRRFQVFSGTCATSVTELFCSGNNNTIAATGLTLGRTYLIRVYSNTGVIFNFNICITDPHNLCAGAVPLTSSPICFNTTGTLVGATYTPVLNACGAALGVRNDVWYRFVANSSNPTITLSGPLAGNQPSIQLFTDCAGTLAPAPNCVLGSANLAAVGLTPGATYLVRVFSNNNTASTFNICITDPHNACASSVLLTSGTGCTTVPGNMFGSSLAATSIIAPDCAVGVTRDVWYRFVAQTTNPTITLSNIGVNFTNPGIQLLSNSCGGPTTSFFCGTTSIPANFLTPGTTYLIRVYSTTVAAPVSPVGAGFDICITDPVATAPFNDQCTNAFNLAIGNNCTNINGTVAGATASAPLITCTGVPAYDVWYKFTAVNTTATVTLSNIGANFITPRLEMFSGTCGSLTSIFCTASPLAAVGLTPGAIYYIRAYSTTGPAPNGNANFRICLTTTNAPVKFGNSYVNITKKTTGGVVETGDVLEIRMTVNHTAGTMTNLRYVDNVPSNTTMATAAPDDSIKIITNEGLMYKKYTLAAGDDAGTYLAAPPAGQYNIRLNLGFGATLPGTPANNTNTEFASATGTMNAAANRPRGGGGMLFAVAYRVVVTGAPGDTIVLNPGQFIYRNGGGDSTLTATPFNILISEPLSLCTNSIGINVADEFGGTFGSGATPNRPTDLTVPISGYNFLSDVNANNSLGDGRYAIVKNMSPRNRTNRNARSRNTCDIPAALAQDDPLNCNNRMHGGHWYIDGDHTGTADAIGNTPPDDTTNGGYMLMVNADWVASEVFQQNLTNLCPNTYYEFSAWIRNICRTCGADSTGAQFTGTPTAPTNGYVGVYPNLSFSLNGVDYYSTGEVDTIGWLNKGFVFRTGASQTSAVFSIRNNSQGGGGNDWVLDDIAVATCLPTMSYSPTINPNVCESNPIEIADTISSFFDNYTTYKWQRSIDGGANWTDLTGVTTLPDTNYYITTYTVPPANTTLADSGNLYRVVVATTAANLVDPNCNISDGVTITLSVLNCNPVLDINLLSFIGKLVESKTNLSWTTSLENSPLTFVVERSDDGMNFKAAGELSSHNNGDNINHYSFKDPLLVSNKIWYRIIMTMPDGKKKHSSIIQLKNNLPDFDISNIINPFTNSLAFNITTAGSSNVTIELINISGKTVMSGKQLVYTGTNSIHLDNTQILPSGIYTLRVINKDRFITKLVVKKN